MWIFLLVMTRMNADDLEGHFLPCFKCRVFVSHEFAFLPTSILLNELSASLKCSDDFEFPNSRWKYVHFFRPACVMKRSKIDHCKFFHSLKTQLYDIESNYINIYDFSLEDYWLKSVFINCDTYCNLLMNNDEMRLLWMTKMQYGGQLQ